MSSIKVPKHLFLELKDKNADYPDQLKKLRAELKKKKEGKHLPILKRRLERGGHYQYRGPAYIHLHDGRGVYNIFPMDLNEIKGEFKGKQPPTLPPGRGWDKWKDLKYWQEKACFPEAGAYPGPKNFFNLKSAVKIKKKLAYYSIFHAPYSWIAHHLIPVQAFGGGTKDDQGKPLFSEKALELISDSGYDVNNGHNLMLVPSDDRDNPVHCLIAQVDNHSDYNEVVIRKLKMLGKSLKNAVARANQGEPHDQLSEEIVEELYGIEDEIWSDLVEVGRKIVVARLRKSRKKVESLYVKYANKGGQKFANGVLA